MNRITSEIIRLSQLSASSTPEHIAQVIKLTINAFRAEKPLFSADQPKKENLEKCLDIFNSAYQQYSISMEPEKRKTAQMSISGLYFITDELSKIYPDLYSKFDQIRKSNYIQSIIEYIDNTTGIEPEFCAPFKDEIIDFSKIPKSHVWWFFEENDEDE